MLKGEESVRTPSHYVQNLAMANPTLKAVGEACELSKL